MRRVDVAAERAGRESSRGTRRLRCAVRIEQLLGLIDRQNDGRIGLRLVEADQPAPGERRQFVEERPRDRPRSAPP